MAVKKNAANANTFPALQALGRTSRARRIPVIQQLEWTDCGAAALASVMGFWGRVTTLSDVRNEMSVGRDGVSARAILETGQRLGLRGRGVKVELADLGLLPKAAILHWEFNHFVVLERVGPEKVEIVDPAVGRRSISMAEFAKCFTGVALVFEPGLSFTTDAPSPKKLRRYQGLWQELKEEGGDLRRVISISLLLRFFALGAPLLTAVVVDRVVPRGDVSLLTVVLIGVLAMSMFDSISSLVRAQLLLQLRARMDSRMTLGFLEQLVSLPFAFFQTRSTGDLLMRVRSNSTIREIVTANSMSALLDGVFVLLYAVAIVFVSPSIALLVFVFTLLNAAVFFVTRGKNHRLMVRDLDVQAKSQDKLVQLLDGMQTLKCAGVEHRAVQAWSKNYVDEVNVSIERGSLSAYIDAVGGLLNAMAPLALLGVGATQVIDGSMSLGAMLAVSALAAGVFEPVQSLLSSAVQFQLLGSYMERVEDVMNRDREQDQKKIVAAPLLTGDIVVDNVSFRYAGDGPNVLESISLRVPAGSSIAVVGASGSGKSTLANLMCGLYQPVSGRILFDGQSLAHLDLKTVRAQIGIVPQHPYIFSGSLRENISMTAPSASLDAIVRAARMACIHDDIMSMPMGYDTVVAGGGDSLSGGQRQRIAIARAVLRQAPIVVLDEATSALDGATERAVTDNLQQLGATRLIVAHRLSTVMGADLIAVMHNGSLVELGSHADLLARGGRYKQMVRLQEHGGETRKGLVA